MQHAVYIPTGRRKVPVRQHSLGPAFDFDSPGGYTLVAKEVPCQRALLLHFPADYGSRRSISIRAKQAAQIGK